MPAGVYQHKKHKEETKKKIAISRLAEKNPMWKGEDVGYDGVHHWVKYRLHKPDFCEKCKERPAIDLANKSGKYKRDLNDWEWLCRKCHMEDDGRINNLRNQGTQRTKSSRTLVS